MRKAAASRFACKYRAACILLLVLALKYGDDTVGLRHVLEGLGTVVGVRTAPQPAYDVLVTDRAFQIRRYHGYVTAAVTVDGPFGQGQNRAFSVLARYIFGGNTGRQALAMTAPVLQARAAPGQTLAMTAPVLQATAGDRLTMAFVMPPGSTLATLPTPLDDAIKFAEVPATAVAVVRFRGAWREARIAAMADELRGWLARRRAYRAVGEPRFAAYDPPWTIPALRRNEVHFDVEPVTTH
jgi:hypothetical protein